ncbi:Pr6Pr family membrane protein [Intrasporangium flavum]|uniref:Pr6Pr family membrane protein n=1 Tax=Intrasporangium flavum TaxID=1428657 RepID=UPI00096C1629|nr:Pr6Pr family membrane protein [Intrasporangium flavum]
MTRLGRWWHLLTFGVVVVALVLQTVLVASGQTVIDSPTTVAALPERLRRLFSYFTIQSNLLVGVAVLLVLLDRTRSQAFRVVRLASLIGITVTGIVAAVALKPPATYTAANLLCDRLLHVVVPVLTVVGWVAFGPRGKVTRGDLLPSLAWPVLWLAATLALGPVVDWYPYPFVDVGTIGYGSTLVNCAVIAALFLGLAAVVLGLDRRLSRSRATMSA